METACCKMLTRSVLFGTFPMLFGLLGCRVQADGGARDRQLSRAKLNAGAFLFNANSATAKLPAILARVSWKQAPELSAAEGALGDYFGASVAVSDDGTIVVGAPQRAVQENPSQGAAYVFARNGSEWLPQVPVLIAPDGARGDTFGLSVASANAGDLVVVGAPGHAVGANPTQGAVYVFARGDQGWTPQGQPLSSLDGNAADGFGGAVAVAGDTILVGAPFHEVNGNAGQGAAYVFVRSGDTWLQQGPELVAADGRAGDAFGSYVALSNDTAVISAPIRHVGNNPYQGAAYVFVRSGEVWTQQGPELVAPDGGAFDQLGPCALSGDTALVGAPFHTIGSRPQQGAAYAFARQGEIWALDGPAWVAADGAAGDQFGNAVALTEQRALVAAWGQRRGPNAYRGAAYLFERNGAAWEAEASPLSADDGAANEIFGTAVALAADTAVIAAPSHRIGANVEQGAAYVFLRDRDTTGNCACRSAGAREQWGAGAPAWLAWTALASVSVMLRRRRASTERVPARGPGA